MIEHLKLLFKDRNIRYNRLENLIKILKTDIECYNYCVFIFEKEQCFKDLKEVLIHLVDGIELRKCKTCGKNILFEKVLEYKRHNREINHCDRKCAPNNFNVEQAKEKRIKALKDHNPFSREDVKEKIRKTNLERYGYENVSSNEEIKKKKNISLLKYRNSISYKMKMLKSFSKFKNYVVPAFTAEEYDGIFKEYKWKCVKCGNIFTQRLRSTNHIKECEEVPRCLKCYPFLNSGISNKEKELSDFCKQFYSNLIENDRELITPYELDIVIPEIKLSIEFNGVYWHSCFYKDKNYHLMKTELCESKGYRLIHIFEDEWNEITKEKLKQILENKEVIQPGIYPRTWFSLHDKRYLAATYSEPILMNNNCYDCGDIKILKIN